MNVRLLLVNPKFPESFWSFRWAIERVLPGKRAVNPPLGLATLAALCPPHWQVAIVDENVEAVPLEPRADLVGVCGMGVQFTRQAELLAYYRGRGYRTVAGGSFASLCPERYGALADTVVAGEAEYVWPRFCSDFEAGVPRAFYHETGAVSLADSPVPRFDLLKLERYTTATLQFSRGCPYRCEFCDIIVMFGRRPRHKSPQQIGRELDALRLRGARSVFFVDDNLIGHRAAAKELLVYLADYQRRHAHPFLLGTEVSLNLARDEELMRLFRAAGFTWVFIGIESPDPDALRETHKTQNLHGDILESVRRVYAHGLDVLAGFIVGFDRDTRPSFDRQLDFIRASGIQVAMVGLLTALPKTPLYERLAREGRLIERAEGADNTKAGTNIVPRNMSYGEMIEGYAALYRRLFSDSGIAERVRNKLAHLRDPAYSGEYRPRERIGIVGRLLVRGVARGGWRRAWHFARSLPWLAPRALPLAIMDWIAGLAMRDYVDRHLAAPRARDTTLATKWFASLQRAIRRHVEAGSARAELLLAADAGPRLNLRLMGRLDGAFFQECSRRLARLLARTRASVTLVVEEIEPRALRDFQRLLRRLARHGDRVFVEVAEPLRLVVAVDSSIFNVALGAGALPAGRE
ncbi:MAG: B12-binding domain-containing radical SAM protein [Burkholderiales bacterium]|nr:B12-binding domain-containing radical SAM protein [Burkholderiales bacterium]